MLGWGHSPYEDLDMGGGGIGRQDQRESEPGQDELPWSYVESLTREILREDHSEFP